MPVPLSYKELAKTYKSLAREIQRISGPRTRDSITIEELRKIDPENITRTEQRFVQEALRRATAADPSDPSLVPDEMRQAIANLNEPPERAERVDSAQRSPRDDLTPDHWLPVRLSFDAEESVSALAVLQALGALREAVSDADEIALAEAVAQGQIEWSDAQDAMRVMQALSSVRIEFLHTKEGSFELVARVGIWLVERFEIDKKLGEIVLNVLGKTAAGRFIEQKALAALDWSAEQLRAPLMRQLARLGFQPKPKPEAEPHSVTLELATRSVEQALKAANACCCPCPRVPG